MPAFEPRDYRFGHIDTPREDTRGDNEILQESPDFESGAADATRRIRVPLRADEIVRNTTTWLKVQTDTILLRYHYSALISSTENFLDSWRQSRTATLPGAPSFTAPDVSTRNFREVDGGGDASVPPLHLGQEVLAAQSQMYDRVSQCSSEQVHWRSGNSADDDDITDASGFEDGSTTYKGSGEVSEDAEYSEYPEHSEHLTKAKATKHRLISSIVKHVDEKDESRNGDETSSVDSCHELMVGEFYQSLRQKWSGVMETLNRGSENVWLWAACHTLLPANYMDKSNRFTHLEQDVSSLAGSEPKAFTSQGSSTETLCTPTISKIPTSSSPKLDLNFEEKPIPHQHFSTPTSRQKKILSWRKRNLRVYSSVTMRNYASYPGQGKRQALPHRDNPSSTSGRDPPSDSNPERYVNEKTSSDSHPFPGELLRSSSPRTHHPSGARTGLTEWAFKFISSRGNEYFCDVDEEYLTDRFNLTGLNTEVQYYQYALDLVTDMFDLECEDDMREQIEKSARHLYGLVHARYIVTTRGLQKMMDKYKKGDFGKCPRVACETQHLLPMGQNDIANVSAVKLYCARCEDLYNPKSQRHAAIDGAYFGTSFHNILFQVYPGLLPPKTQRRYEPRVFGFRVHAYAALARWQAEQKDKMKKRLEDLNIETGFEEEDEEQESDIGIESGGEDGDALDDMFEGNRRVTHA